MARQHDVTSKPKRDGRKENAEATQAALRAAGRRLFGTLGYDATSVGALCAEAGVTTGALYHHFKDKKGLFAAVAEELDAGLVQRALGARQALAAAKVDPWQAFLAGIDAVLEAGVDPTGRRIGLTDAAAVLGAKEWIEIRERHGLGAMLNTVQALQGARVMIDGDTRRLARIVLGLVYGAIEALPEAGPRQAALSETRRVVHAMLEGLRRDAKPARVVLAGRRRRR